MPERKRFCVILAFLAVLFFPGAVWASQDVFISEVYNDPSSYWGDYFEFVIQGHAGEDFSIGGWQFETYDGEHIHFNPTVLHNLTDNTYVSVRVTCCLPDDLDASDGSAHIDLGVGADILNNAGDEVGLYDASGNLIDFVRYGGGNGGPVLGGWSASDPGPTANSGESMQIFGPDHNSSANWLGEPPSEGQPNTYVADISNPLGSINVILRDGLNADVPVTDPTKGVDINVMRGSAAVDLNELKIFEEMIDYSYNYYKTWGFNDPATGTDLKMVVTVTKNGIFDAGTYGDGDIIIDFGGDLNDLRVASFVKWSMEHEFLHAIQFARFTSAGVLDPNGPINHDPRASDGTNAFISEGQCEYWGAEISKAQYGVSDENLYSASRYLDSAFLQFNSIPYDFQNDILRNSNVNLFGLKTQNHDTYTQGYMFSTFIASMYGKSMLKAIYDATRNDHNGGPSVIGKDAIEKGFRDMGNPKTFEQLMDEKTRWVYDSFKSTMPFHSTTSLNDTTQSTIQGTLAPWGSEYSVINVNTANKIEMTFNTVDPGAVVSVTVIVENNDGSSYTQKLRFPPNPHKLVLPGTNVKRIVVIVTQVGGTLISPYSIQSKALVTTPPMPPTPPGGGGVTRKHPPMYITPLDNPYSPYHLVH